MGVSLCSLRAILAASVAEIVPNRETRIAADSSAEAHVEQTDLTGAARAAAEDAAQAGDSGSAITSTDAAEAAFKAASYTAHSADKSVVYLGHYAELSTAETASLHALSADSRDVSSVLILITRPLWPEGLGFEGIYPNQIHRAAEANPVWSFWARWYDGFLQGAPLDWELQTQIALIPDEAWQKAEGETWQQVAERITRIIADIEREFYRMRLETALRQVERLKRQSRLKSIVAKGLARQIQTALDEYRRTVCNALPGALEPLDRLPGLLDQTAGTLLNERPDDEIAELVVAMADTIGELNRRLTAVHQELATRPEKASAATLVREGAYRSVGAGIAAFGGVALGTLFAPDTWGYILSAMGELVGPSQAEQIGALGDCYDSLIGPDAIYPPELWAPPDYSET